MQLYLLRHGIACEAAEWHGDDASRPLTDEGRERTKEVVEALRKQGKLRVSGIWSSPLTRALETAKIAGEVLDAPVKVVEALACGATVEGLQAVLRRTRPLPERLMLVGHEPDCGEMIGELIGDQAGDYALKKAGIAALKGSFKAGGMVLKWKLAPKDVL
ncbi:MAG: phosphohistidine phosphatase SixA [Planctomycetota bacterium]|nr:phosphohistidine phosphatase SixA [Planctomycetota bacterium]